MSLVILIVALSAQIQNTLTQQEAANKAANDALAQLNQQLLLVQNVSSTLEAIQNANSFFVQSGFTNFS